MAKAGIVSVAAGTPLGLTSPAARAHSRGGRQAAARMLRIGRARALVITAAVAGLTAGLAGCGPAQSGGQSSGPVLPAVPGGPPVIANAAQLLVPAHGALFGAWVQPASWAGGTTKAEESAVLGFERRIGRKLAIDQLYTPWAGQLPVAVARWDLRHGRLPMISWGGTNTARIAAGDYDAQIRATARKLRGLHGPVMLRWFAEMSNGENRRLAGSGTSFVAAWRHIHGIFVRAGATNVLWVWCPGAHDFAHGHAQQFYPGNSYVDWIGADGFNWAPKRPGVAWASFAQIFAPFYRWAAHSGKPLLVGETGALEGGRGEKASWFTQAGQELKTELPAIRAVVYFESDTTDHNHDRLLFDWRATSSSSALRGFTNLVTDPYFQARPTLR